MTYDVIVVGAGASGAIVAARSAASGHSVLLIEAGGATSISGKEYWDPMLWAELPGNPAIAWDYLSVPQPNLDNRVIPMSRAKALGGCTLHNAMVYVRGAQADYDTWETMGCTGWGWKEVLPYFERAEGAFGIWTAPSNAFIDSLFRAANDQGIPFNPDYNGDAGQFGSANFRFTIDPATGLRQTSYSVYLGAEPTRVQTVAGLVVSILFNGTTAVGVRVIPADGTAPEAYYGGTIVLSAGTIGSPHILLLSGIGPAAQLQQFDIPVLLDQPQIGQHLHDDLFGTVTYSSPGPLPPQPYGLLGAVVFASTTGSPDEIDFESSLSSGAMAGMGPPYRPNSYWLWPNFLHLRSTGSVSLASADPTVPPLIDPGYLTDPADMQICVDGIKLARAIGGDPALAPWRTEEILPGPDVVTDDEIAAYLRATAGTTYHYVSTCRMGSNADAVVDPTLQVKGVHNLHVIDASIVPHRITGNTAAVSFMIGEKGAALLLE
ncbi:MAG TPA: GMC oxidoreductase [Thermoanaerobaculia bacterium]|nr:GMC oxidoreductase [Thermoanaerobaculia bacterium]